MEITLIGLFLKLTGLQKLWDMMDGYKAYAAGFGAMLTGLGLMATSGAGLVMQFAALTGWHQDLVWFENFRHNGNAIQFGTGWGAFLLGLKTVGDRHAQQKTLDAAKTQQVVFLSPEKASAPLPTAAAPIPPATVQISVVPVHVEPPAERQVLSGQPDSHTQE